MNAPAAPVTQWARDVASAVERLLEDRKISHRRIAEMIGRSQNYVSMRLRGEAPLSLSDVDAITEALGLNAGSFLAGVSPVATNVIPIGTRLTLEDQMEYDPEAVDLTSQPYAAKEGTPKVDQEDHVE